MTTRAPTNVVDFLVTHEGDSNDQSNKQAQKIGQATAKFALKDSRRRVNPARADVVRTTPTDRHGKRTLKQYQAMTYMAYNEPPMLLTLEEMDENNGICHQ